MKTLLQVLIAAGLVWISSEILEVVTGGRTPLSLWITAVFHLLMAFGIWGACGSQAGGRGKVSLVAAAVASVGYFILIYPPIAVSQAASLTIGEYIQGSTYFTTATNPADRDGQGWTATPSSRDRSRRMKAGVGRYARNGTSVQ